MFISRKGPQIECADVRVRILHLLPVARCTALGVHFRARLNLLLRKGLRTLRCNRAARREHRASCHKPNTPMRATQTDTESPDQTGKSRIECMHDLPPAYVTDLKIARKTDGMELRNWYRGTFGLHQKLFANETHRQSPANSGHQVARS